MATYQQSVMTAWKQVNAASASLNLTGAASAFRHAITRTDLASLTPEWEYGSFKVYVLESLEGQLVWVDQTRECAIVGRRLYRILASDYDVLQDFVRDLSRGASGVKVIEYNAGPYQAAGAAWRAAQDDDTVAAVDPFGDLQGNIERVLARVQAMGTAPLESEQYQVLFTELAAASEGYEQLQQRMQHLASLLDLARDAVATRA